VGGDLLKDNFHREPDAYLFRRRARNVAEHVDASLLYEFDDGQCVGLKCPKRGVPRIMRDGVGADHAAAADRLKGQVDRQAIKANRYWGMVVLLATLAPLHNQAPLVGGIPEWTTQLVDLWSWLGRDPHTGTHRRAAPSEFRGAITTRFRYAGTAHLIAAIGELRGVVHLVLDT
jgi:hypothetical protein